MLEKIKNLSKKNENTTIEDENVENDLVINEVSMSEEDNEEIPEFLEEDNIIEDEIPHFVDEEGISHSTYEEDFEKKNEKEESSWRNSVSDAVDSISNMFSSKNKEESSSEEISKIIETFDEIVGEVKLKDGIIYANTHMEVMKIGVPLVTNNILVIFPQTVKRGGELVEEKQKIMKFSNDGWFQVLSDSCNLSNITIEKVKTLKKIY